MFIFILFMRFCSYSFPVIIGQYFLCFHAIFLCVARKFGNFLIFCLVSEQDFVQIMSGFL